jgi:hypothetical protein
LSDGTIVACSDEYVVSISTGLGAKFLTAGGENDTRLSNAIAAKGAETLKSRGELVTKIARDGSHQWHSVGRHASRVRARERIHPKGTPTSVGKTHQRMRGMGHRESIEMPMSVDLVSSSRGPTESTSDLGGELQAVVSPVSLFLHEVDFVSVKAESWVERKLAHGTIHDATVSGSLEAATLPVLLLWLEETSNC